MDALNKEIAALKAKIDRYEAEYETASAARKDQLLDTINTKSKILIELEKRKTAATAGTRS
jgi:hypothetical protein